MKVQIVTKIASKVRIAVFLSVRSGLVRAGQATVGKIGLAMIYGKGFSFKATNSVRQTGPN